MLCGKRFCVTVNKSMEIYGQFPERWPVEGTGHSSWGVLLGGLFAAIFPLWCDFNEKENSGALFLLLIHLFRSFRSRDRSLIFSFNFVLDVDGSIKEQTFVKL